MARILLELAKTIDFRPVSSTPPFRVLQGVVVYPAEQLEGEEPEPGQRLLSCHGKGYQRLRAGQGGQRLYPRGQDGIILGSGPDDRTLGRASTLLNPFLPAAAAAAAVPLY